ncbi:hypothetical protein BGX34_008723 [Mortierella sp. NVP85]|nr:hypothetical protein BGX34_008723 [Mortierella sp. NVP85]
MALKGLHTIVTLNNHNHNHNNNNKSSTLRISSTPALASAPRYHYGSPRHLDYIPDCLDPSMALPRGLPRTTTQHDHNIYRDSFYSGIGQENDWRQLEQLDPDSLAGIHIYGDTTDLQQQPSPVSASYKYSAMGYNFNTFTPTSRWRGQSLQHQQPNKPRPEDEDDEFRAEITARQSRQPTHQFHEQEHLQQQQPRQLASPASTFVEKERKLTRFSSRFSFLNRRRQTQDHQQHNRNDSMPTSAKDAWSPGSGSNPSQQRFPSLTIRPLGWPTTHGAGEQTGANGESRPRVETPTSKAKGNNRVKQIFKEVLSLATKKKGRRSPEPPFRDISLPSTYIRATPSPLHLQNQDPVSPYNPNHHAVTMAQRKGLITPVSRTDTAPSNYHNDNTHINNISINNINGKSTRNARESLVDPIQPHLAFQKMELGEDEDELANQSPFGQTSLTPPPASSVLRHSASSHHLFGHGLGDGEPIFISPEATEPEPALPLRSSTLGEVPVARPSSQLMPVTKELVNSECDTMGGQEHHATASNTTPFNPPQSQQIPNNPNSSQPEKEQQQQSSGIRPLDDDRRVSKSTFEHGAKVMAIAQVQKVDLEGLRQSHHHHSPPIHSHSLNMVTVEAPFA